MRWLAIAAAILLIAIVALFGVGYFLLPARLKIEAATEIPRPRAAVFALIQNLDTFDEWAPWFAANPELTVEVEGEAGVGQLAAWSSRSGNAPKGSNTITAVIPHERVESVIAFKGRGSANMSWSLERAPGGSRVVWTVSSTCTDNPLRVACRYVSLFSRDAVEREMQEGLERLRAMAELLPDVDFERLSPDFLQATPSPFAYVENTVARESPSDAGEIDPEQAAALEAAYAERVATAISESLAVVRTALEAASAAPTGPQTVVTLAHEDGQINFRAGYPVAGQRPIADPRIVIGATPAGKVMRVEHIGPPNQLPLTYRLIGAYMAARRISGTGVSWEVAVRNTGDPATMRTDIYVPIQ